MPCATTRPPTRSSASEARAARHVGHRGRSPAGPRRGGDLHDDAGRAAPRVLRAPDSETRALRLRRLALVESEFQALPIDEDVARAYGTIVAGAQAARHRRPRTADALIAATAVANDLPVYTRARGVDPAEDGPERGRVRRRSPSTSPAGRPSTSDRSRSAAALVRAASRARARAAPAARRSRRASPQRRDRRPRSRSPSTHRADAWPRSACSPPGR